MRSLRVRLDRNPTSSMTITKGSHKVQQRSQLSRNPQGTSPGRSSPREYPIGFGSSRSLLQTPFMVYNLPQTFHTKWVSKAFHVRNRQLCEKHNTSRGSNLKSAFLGEFLLSKAEKHASQGDFSRRMQW